MAEMSKPMGRGEFLELRKFVTGKSQQMFEGTDDSYVPKTKNKKAKVAKIDNENDLVYAVAKRVRELADKPLPELRSIAGYGCDTQAEAIRHNKHRKRGDLIEEILCEEFIREFPRDFQEE